MISIFRFLTVILCTLILLPVGCGGADYEAFNSAIESAQKNTSGIHIRVDPRIELLTAVQYLAGYAKIGRMTRYPIDYLGEINQYFGKYAKHRAVSLFQEMYRIGFSYDAPVWLVLHYGPLPEMKKLAEPPEELLMRCGGAEKAEEFVVELRDFAKASDFKVFFAEHAALYSSLIDGVSSQIAGVRISDLEDYYGYGQNSYSIILAPLLHHGGYGPRIAREDGSFDVYSVVGPHGANREVPFFGKPADFEYIVWHEFSHSFINPLVDEYWDELKPLGAALFEPVKDTLPRSYTTWEVTYGEYLVRAVVLRLMAIHQGDAQAASTLVKEQGRGFLSIESLTRALEKYEQNRGTYPTLKDYMPVLVETFIEAASGIEIQ